MSAAAVADINKYKFSVCVFFFFVIYFCSITAAMQVVLVSPF